MAIDSWIFDQCHRGLMPPTLRFYTWSPAAISLGRNQRSWPAHWPDVSWQQQPVDLVRRPTGGRAVLHAGDLTYAIAHSIPIRNRRQAYEHLCQFLIQGWQTLGVQLQFGQARRNYTAHVNCFSTATRADLVLANGYKLIGSAQAWQGQTVLQHGSMRLHPDQKLATQVFGMAPNKDQWIPAQIPNFSVDEIINSLIQAAEICFDAQFELQPLCAQEWAAITTVMAAHPPLIHPNQT